MNCLIKLEFSKMLQIKHFCGIQFANKISRSMKCLKKYGQPIKITPKDIFYKTNYTKLTQILLFLNGMFCKLCFLTETIATSESLS